MPRVPEMHMPVFPLLRGVTRGKAVTCRGSGRRFLFRPALKLWCGGTKDDMHLHVPCAQSMGRAALNLLNARDSMTSILCHSVFRAQTVIRIMKGLVSPPHESAMRTTLGPSCLEPLERRGQQDTH